MSIYKRNENGPWWVDLATPSGKRIRRSTGTTIKKEAQQYHDRLKAEMWKIDKLDAPPEYIFEEALLHYVRSAEGQKDTATKKRHAIYWRSKFSGRVLSSLTTQEILQHIPTKNMNTKKPLANATQNKYIKSISLILNLAHKAGILDKVPYIPKKKEPPIRVRWITKEQARELIGKLSQEWMRAICSFALMTGARRTEILTLTWDKIDFVRKVALVTNDVAKSGKARSLLLNDEAIALLKSIRNRHSKYVFVGRNGNPLTDINRKSFTLATKKCFLVDFHFHDLRHTWASWHVQAGTPLFTLKELGGWETLEMVKKYAHLNAEHLLEHANKVEFHGTFTTHPKPKTHLKLVA
ncbi:tyrosine-type recombinase/integrase [Rodentibacter caecimuris]|uniref:tyrosine-type recombinase/integrase n=1 Tax=Rodentibacter caecimuris TaxID=1796644 RepID=UPI00211A70FA|nr:site-specific integrase [Rodentibacter heylii]MCQ9124321.1 tyrosine-type recombinase/integrase [Rodentibacter heylii]